MLPDVMDVAKNVRNRERLIATDVVVRDVFHQVPPVKSVNIGMIVRNVMRRPIARYDEAIIYRKVKSMNKKFNIWYFDEWSFWKGFRFRDVLVEGKERSRT